MNLDKLADQLTKHEGLRLKPYVDTVGKVTIGIGHNLTDRGLTVHQVEDLLADDIQEVVTWLDAKLPWHKDLDEVRQRVLADLAFVMMDKLLAFHTTLGCLQSKDWEGAATALLESKFAAQVGKRALDLAYMIRTGEDPQ